MQLSDWEFGHVIKEAFPSASRKRSNSSWYYYGVQHVREVSKAELSNEATHYSQKLSGETFTQENPVSPEQEVSCDEDSVQGNDLGSASVEVR